MELSPVTSQPSASTPAGDLPRQDLRSQFDALLRRKWIVALCVVIFPVVAYLYSSRQPAQYRSDALVRVHPEISAASLLGSNPSGEERDLETPARLTKTTYVARLAAKRLEPRPTSLRGLYSQITVVPDENASFLTITAVDHSAERAADIANAFAKALREARAKETRDQIKPAIAGVEKNLERLQGLDPDNTEGIRQLYEQLQRLRAISASSASNVELTEAAIAATTPFAPRPIRDAFAGLMFGLLVGVGLAFLIEGLDRRIRDVDLVERLAGVPLLSVVPLGKRPDEPSPQLAEAFKTLRASLTYFNIDRALKTVMVVSPMKGDGKTLVATHLGVAMARAGKRVTIIDLDMRHPRVDTRLIGEHADFGVGAVLVEEQTLEDALIEVEIDDEEGRLRILPSGPPPPNPSELIASRGMRSLLSELSITNDLVIIDSPPCLVVSDVIPLFSEVSGIVAVAQLSKTRRDSLRRMMSVIRTANGVPLGVVVTTKKPPSGSDGYGGYGYGGYGYGGYGYTDYESEDEEADLAGRGRERAGAASGNGRGPKRKPFSAAGRGDGNSRGGRRGQKRRLSRMRF